MNRPKKLTAAEFAASRSLLRAEMAPTAEALARQCLIEEKGRLKAKFENNMGKVSKHPIDITFLRSELLDEASQAFAEGFVLVHMKNSPDRRYAVSNILKQGLFYWLGTERARREREMLENGEVPGDLRIGLEAIDEDLLVAFKNAVDDETSDHHAPAELTRRSKIADAQAILKRLALSEYWKDKLSPNFRPLLNLYPGAAKDVKHREPVKDASFDELYAFASLECEQIMASLKAPQAKMRSIDGSALTLEEAARSSEALAAYLAARHVGVVPSHYKLGRTSQAFGRLVSVETFRAAERLLYPTLREMVPFVIVLASIYALNAGVALEMKINDFKIRDFLGSKRIRIFPNKPKSDRRQRHEVTVTDDHDNPGVLLPWLRERTDRLRVSLPLERQLNLFVRYDPYGNDAIAMLFADASWNVAMVDFEDKHGMRPEREPSKKKRTPAVQLSQLRPTALDRVHELTGGDIVVVQAVANHQVLSTTEEFYRTRGMTMRNEERLAEAMAARHRDIRTGGLVSNLERPMELDKGAATPGFKCLDPYDREMGRQKDGELCGAYGMCPMCQLGWVDYSSPVACALLHNLADRMEEAQLHGAQAWLDRWMPVQRKLAVHLLQFPDEIHERARRAIVPTLPPLE